MANKEVRIRMYNVGFGDAFLVLIPANGNNDESCLTAVRYKLQRMFRWLLSSIALLKT